MTIIRFGQSPNSETLRVNIATWRVLGEVAASLLQTDHDPGAHSSHSFVIVSHDGGVGGGSQGEHPLTQPGDRCLTVPFFDLDADCVTTEVFRRPER